MVSLKFINFLLICNIVNIVENMSLHNNSDIQERKELEVRKTIKSIISVDYGPCWHINIIKCSHDDKSVNSFSFPESEKIKKLFLFGAYKLPYVGVGLEALSISFFPDEKDVWSEIKNNVQNLIDKNTLQLISGILSGDIRMYKEKIKLLSSEINNPQQINSSFHYMNIAEDLIGFEKKFMFDKNYPDYKNTNYHLLPLYSTVVLMKTSYYTIGIKCAEKIGLTSNQVNKIKNYMTTCIKSNDGANNYINEMLEERLNNAYTTSNKFNIYNKIMSVKGYISINGLEYTSIWNNLMDNPFSDKKINGSVISYSTLWGRATLNMNSQLLQISEPLTPDLINGTRNKIISIGVYTWHINKAPRIGGIKIFFENGANYSLGGPTNKYDKFDLNGSVIKTLQVHGDGAIDRLIFYLSDKRVLSYGEDHDYGIRNNEPSYARKFEEDSHHISSLFLSNDANIFLSGQAANIAVTYQLDEPNNNIYNKWTC